MVLSTVVTIGIVILNIIYFFIKLLPTQNKITMISRQSNKPSYDFLLLEKEILNKNKNTKVVILCKELKNGYKSTIKDKIMYIFHMFKQMYHIATSKVVILDSYCIVISILKHKKRLKVIQMWHSMGTMKKFGYAILDKAEGSKEKLAKKMKMHCNYDYIFASSEAYKKDLAKGFNYTMDHILTYPLPRVDLLNDKKYQNEMKEKIYKKFPSLKKKKNIIYCPTFRKNEENLQKAIDKLVEATNLSKYNLIIKLHPLSKIKVDKPGILVEKNFSTFDILSVADFVISDYSCVIYEAAQLNIPLYFYSFDIEKYLNERGLALDYNKELPGVISKDAKEIIDAIENRKYDFPSLKKFVSKYVKQTNHATKDIVNFIFQIMED